ncbi:DUF1801 domain-containing protein [Woodsholea maritima]|uniref:DUF1801 domain-containing protein n=1 Tax=Woodsholea maritima TaxID=240237 RepID=UPI0003796154|nr:DUF1801 domain-containing protein [Woodsholea maritima]
MSENKTQATCVDVHRYLAGVEPQRRREDSLILLDLFQEATGWQPRMWGPSMVGFGRYHYKYDTGREGDFFATGFAPRKAKMVAYIMPGYQDYSDILSRLGKHKLGKSCLYFNTLADLDLEVLKTLIKTGIRDLAQKYEVFDQ